MIKHYMEAYADMDLGPNWRLVCEDPSECGKVIGGVCPYEKYWRHLYAGTAKIRSRQVVVGRIEIEPKFTGEETPDFSIAFIVEEKVNETV